MFTLTEPRFPYTPLFRSPRSSADGAPFASIPDVVVTAQKRSESINAVPMSITALGGAELAQRGIANVADLAKVVPGLTFAPSLNNTPVYSLRGIGFNDSGFGSAPAVAVYIDESPLRSEEHTSEIQSLMRISYAVSCLKKK